MVPLIEKPSWLRDWLGNLNWDIFTWHVYIGDALEEAIDWLLGWVNVLWEWLSSLWAYLVDLRDEIIEALSLIWDNLTTEVIKILETFSTWGDILNEWWEARKAWIIDLIATATQGLTTLRLAWDNFWTSIYPTLIDFSWIISWWHDKLHDIDDLIRGKIAEIAPLWEGWQEFAQDISDFFADPIEWLWSRFINWFLGPEV